MSNQNSQVPERFPKPTHIEAADRPSREDGGDGGPPSLTVLLRSQLFEVNTDGKTRAQKLVAAWIEEAAGGNFRALQEILVRVDGEAKAHQEAAAPGAGVVATGLPEVDERKARKILEAIDDDRDDLPGH